MSTNLDVVLKVQVSRRQIRAVPGDTTKATVYSNGRSKKITTDKFEYCYFTLDS
ncbi:MAG: hypothetical protein JWR18_2749 [Segetibacter sp.]|nr:hypothetical protein [Segetibacter sp.]